MFYVFFFFFFFFFGGGGGEGGVPLFLSFFMFGHSLISIKRRLSMFKTLRNFCERFLFSKTTIQYFVVGKIYCLGNFHRKTAVRPFLENGCTMRVQTYILLRKSK